MKGEIECLCIDDTQKPANIDIENWVEKGKIYHIIHVLFHIAQGIQGVQLKEVRTKSEMYDSYKLSRFAVNINNIRSLKELMRNCSELNDLDIDKLLEESQLTIINDDY